MTSVTDPLKEFATWLALNSDREFRHLLESLETMAATKSGAARSAGQTRLIVDEALRRGYRLDPKGPDSRWIGGYHINLILPSGRRLHLPLPPGFVL